MAGSVRSVADGDTHVNAVSLRAKNLPPINSTATNGVAQEMENSGLDSPLLSITYGMQYPGTKKPKENNLTFISHVLTLPMQRQLNGSI